MRPLFLSLCGVVLVLAAARAAQSGGDGGGGGGMPQLPVGQTFKEFEYPDYENGTLKATVRAVEATGITLNRVQAKTLKIEIYENGAVTTTVTSPNADLYLNSQINEQKMRTKNTVRIDRSDLTATSQDCDFDLKNKKYLLRTNVKVILKHFDISLTPATNAPAATKPASANSTPSAPPNAAAPLPNSDSMLDSPGAYATTNTGPIAPQPNSDSK